MPPQKNGAEEEANESTPLLAAANPVDATEELDNKPASNVEDKPLPVGQIILLCYARLVEPIAFFSIFPFINQMIWETGDLDEADVGFYSGLIESLFSLTQMLLMISWGRAADRLGRKPILVFSLVGVSISVALFGFSKTIWQMVIFRCLAGVFAGTIVTVRTMIFENSTKETQARAFSFFAFSGNLGIFIGPLIGGALAKPATQFPGVFGGVGFFEEYPYALSTIVIGAIGASAAIISAIFIKETLHRKGDNSKTSTEAPMTAWEVLKAPGVGFVLFIYSHTMLLAFAYTAVSPIFQFTPINLGGYSFTPLQISAFISLAGVSQALWILVAFPTLHKRFGTVAVLKGCYYTWPFSFLIMPFGNFLLKHNKTTAFWVILPVASALGAGVSMAFTGVQLALNDVAPSYTTLGTLNALALTAVSGTRAFSPALFASIFAEGARRQVLGGYLIWLILVILAVIAAVAVQWLPERGRISDKVKDAPDVDED